ncbi:MAG: transcriptional regulator [Gammaproteobacteria bacterium]|nr:transcriptional regulator [Gammaproteobacteria bacterium]MCW8924491.1 transcriptional regulator [Gammaproteobacteria bacterium]
MLIKGPLNISIIDTDTGERELHLKFSPEFKTLKLNQQCDAFHEFLHYLKTEIDILEDSDPNRHGILTIQQIAEQLLPHIEANEIPLEDAIVVNIHPDTPFGNLVIER